MRTPKGFIAGLVAVMLVVFSFNLCLIQAAVAASQGASTIPYSGLLSKQDGQPTADGLYDFNFALYDSETGGALLWSELKQGIMVKGGDLVTLLGSVIPIPEGIMGREQLYLAIRVKSPGEADFTNLDPRQQLKAQAALSSGKLTALTAGPSCPHDHWNESWSGTSFYGLTLENSGEGDGIRAYSNSPDNSYAAVWGVNISSGTGVYGQSSTGHGVYAVGSGGTRNNASLRVRNSKAVDGMAAYLDNNSGYHTAHFANAGTGGVLYLQNGGTGFDGTGGGDFISARIKEETDNQFRVLTTGEVRSDVGFNTPAADFAEMLPGVEGLEAGEVLVIGPEGILERSDKPYQISVAGVYSTKPGFVGGHPVQDKVPGTIPLSIVGIVPVKVSGENGSISPGDMLVTSSTPGHAMKAGFNPPLGSVIGKALERLVEPIGVIKILATLQ